MEVATGGVYTYRVFRNLECWKALKRGPVVMVEHWAKQGILAKLKSQVYWLNRCGERYIKRNGLSMCSH